MCVSFLFLVVVVAVGCCCCGVKMCYVIQSCKRKTISSVCVKTHTSFCARFSSKPVIMQTKTIQFLLFLQLKKMRGKAQPVVHHMCFQVYRSRTDFRTGKIIRKQMILLTEKICRSTSFFYNPISDTGYTFLCF